MEVSFYYWLFGALAFVLGAAIGSFLNVGIYRLPRDISIKQPRRSFCPNCKTQIPWRQNIPIVSWLLLRARCANCGARIAFRYLGVELLTALLFLAVWQIFPWKIAIAYWIFISILLIATFVDLEHFIIPDQITIGGTSAGILASFLVPELMSTDSRMAALVRSALAAALGYVILWIILEGGKIAFGKKRVKLDGPTPFTWTRHGDDADFVVGLEPFQNNAGPVSLVEIEFLEELPGGATGAGVLFLGKAQLSGEFVVHLANQHGRVAEAHERVQVFQPLILE